MKVKDLPRANEIYDRLTIMESQLVELKRTQQCNVAIGFKIELIDSKLDHPSAVAFRAVRAAIIALCQAQIAEIQKELAKMGVKL